MKTRRLPRTDSINKLARFWEAHDLTDFEDELEKVKEPVFERRTVIPLNMESAEAKAVRKLEEEGRY